VNDLAPSGNLMSVYQNYRHRACWQLSACHEELGDFDAALQFALMARDRYPYQTWCGTCAAEARSALEERIERLKRRPKE
jgi:hypothetical protein